MKKTNLWLLITIVIILIVSLIVYFGKDNKKDAVYKDFAIQDTASVDKIFLANRNTSVLLERQDDNTWLLNKEYKARKDLVNLLLSTMYEIEVSSPVSEAKLDKVLKSLSVKGIKTQIYQNQKLTKTYYVGGVTPDNTGTYMIMENSELPFVTHIPGFTGYLTVRYLPDLKEWRDKTIFNYNFNDIARVKIEYSKNPEEGFIIEKNKNNRYELKNIDNQVVGFNVDSLKIKDYIGRIKYLSFEAFIKDELQKHKLDSLKQEPILARYEVEDNNGETTSFTTYLHQNTAGSLDDEGNLYEWDIDRVYGIVNNDTEVVFLQFYNLDPISTTLSYFKQE